MITLNVSSIFEDHINTDDIIPAIYLLESTERSHFAQYAFKHFDPDFIVRTTQYEKNVIIAGENFGSGSSREQAVYALLENNIQVVIAKSFPDIFYRNALNNGLVAIRYVDVERFSLGDEIVLDLEDLSINHNNLTLNFEMDSRDKSIFLSGGKTGVVSEKLKNYLSGNLVRSKKAVGWKEVSTKSQTIVEKIISFHVKKNVYAGDFMEEVPVDLLFISDIFGSIVINEYHNNFEETFKTSKSALKMHDAKEVIFIADHDVPVSSVQSANNIKKIRDFCNDHGCEFYKPGEGVEHVVLMEDGYILPGSIVLGTDSHTCTGGALNALSMGVGITDATYAMAIGTLHDLNVPETVRINFTGSLSKGVYAKDVVLYILGIVGVSGCSKKVVEFGGDGLAKLDISSRATISNMVVEMGARGSLFEYDDITKEYLENRAKKEYLYLNPDKDCIYSDTLNINLCDIQPCVAFPHKPDNVTFISNIDAFIKESNRINDEKLFPAIESKKVDAIYIGSCTNGRYEDLKVAADILKGNKIHESVDVIVIPASRKVYQKLLREDLISVFIDVGAQVVTSSCGPCYGNQLNVIGDDMTILSTSNRNFIGRMGSKKGRVFLCSPATAAVSAITGFIADPRNYL